MNIQEIAKIEKGSPEYMALTPYLKGRHTKIMRHRTQTPREYGMQVGQHIWWVNNSHEVVECKITYIGGAKSPYSAHQVRFREVKSGNLVNTFMYLYKAGHVTKKGAQRALLARLRKQLRMESKAITRLSTLNRNINSLIKALK
jgi:hypothetical protein